MNFNSHLKSLRLEILETLFLEKPLMIERFFPILDKAIQLLEDDCRFWMKELSENSPNDIPITKQAVLNQRKLWEVSNDITRNSFPSVSDTCEQIFTYWQEGDCCENQSQFYYYKDKLTNIIIKESGLGNIEYMNNTEVRFDRYNYELGIALVHDLDGIVKLDELY